MDDLVPVNGDLCRTQVKPLRSGNTNDAPPYNEDLMDSISLFLIIRESSRANGFVPS